MKWQARRIGRNLGVYDDEAFMNLAKSRGQAMIPPKDDPDFDAGSMLAVKGDVSEIKILDPNLNDLFTFSKV